jgi:hypothetical protein
MMLLFFALWLAVIVLAWMVARRRPEHRAVAVLLSVGFAADIVRPMFDGIAAPPDAAPSLQRLAWIAGVVAHALALLWPAALVGAAIVVFSGKKPWAAVAGWACALAALVIVHPAREDQARAFALVQLLAVAWAAVLGVGWYRRRGDGSMSSAHFALAMILSTELVSLLGAWRVGPFEHWPISQVLYILLFVMLIVSQWRYLWSSPQPSA